MRRVEMRSLALFALLSLLLGSAPAIGSDFAFATGDGSPTPGPDPLELPQASVNQEIHLFLDIAGIDVSSTPCVAGASGHEICGFDMTVTIAGGHQNVSFTPAGTVKFSQQTINATTTTIHAVGLDALSPGVVPQLVGVIQLDTEPFELNVIVSGTVIPADISLDPPPSIEDETVAFVPEPDSILVLIAGALALNALHFMRSRRDSFSPAHAGR